MTWTDDAYDVYVTVEMIDWYVEMDSDDVPQLWQKQSISFDIYDANGEQISLVDDVEYLDTVTKVDLAFDGLEATEGLTWIALPSYDYTAV